MKTIKLLALAALLALSAGTARSARPRHLSRPGAGQGRPGRRPQDRRRDPQAHPAGLWRQLVRRLPGAGPLLPRPRQPADSGSQLRAGPREHRPHGRQSGHRRNGIRFRWKRAYPRWPSSARAASCSTARRAASLKPCAAWSPSAVTSFLVQWKPVREALLGGDGELLKNDRFQRPETTVGSASPQLSGASVLGVLVGVDDAVGHGDGGEHGQHPQHRGHHAPVIEQRAQITSTMRSGRSMKPTLHWPMRASARARV